MAVQQGVVLVEQWDIVFQVGVEQVLVGLVAGLGVQGKQAQALNNPAGVGVDDERRLFGGVDQDVVGGLGSNAVDGQKLLAQRAKITA